VDRLYVNAVDDRAIGYFDLQTGAPVNELPTQTEPLRERLPGGSATIQR
jgi:hypothetical protein